MSKQRELASVPVEAAEAAPAWTLAPRAASGEAAQNEQVNVQIHLSKMPLLANLTKEEIQRVKANLWIRQYARREVVLQKGGPGDSPLILLSCQLQVVDITEDGHETGLHILSPGDFFGEIAVVNDSSRSASVVALTLVLVALLPAPTALHLFSHSPSVANQMLRYLAQEI